MRFSNDIYRKAYPKTAPAPKVESAVETFSSSDNVEEVSSVEEVEEGVEVNGDNTDN